MKKLVAVFAVALFALAVVGPSFAQQAPAQAPKGIEGPDAKKKVEPKGVEGPDVKKKVEPKGIEGPDANKKK